MIEFKFVLFSSPWIGAASSENSVIIYGASSSVGAYAVQLAKRTGLYVIGIAGESCDYVNSLGADAVLDYRKYKSAEGLVSLQVYLFTA